MADTPTTLQSQQWQLTRHLRDPQASAAPSGMDDRRLQVYRDLLFNNLSSLLAGSFPVLTGLLGDDDWTTLVRRFYREHRCQTPLFTEVAAEFVGWLQALPDPQPGFMAELAHYEWVEQALLLLDAHPLLAGDASQLLERPLLRSPLAWPLAYRWPVHQLRPDYQPLQPPATPTLLLARREPSGEVRFSELSPLAWRLLQRLDEAPDLHGTAQLIALAAESGDAPEAMLAAGTPLLRQMHAAGVIAPRQS